MDLAELYSHIARGEDLHTERKEWPIHRDKLAATLVAFANVDGGVLLLGVDDQGATVGVEDADKVMRFVDTVAFNNCVPPISVAQEALTTEAAPARPVVAVTVARGEMRPYRTQKGNTIYVRTGSGRRPASREEILRLFQASGSFFYDENRLPQLSLSDLDLDAFDNYLRETGLEAVHPSREQLLVNWRLLSADRHPTLAGMILFGRHPQRHLPFAQINAAREFLERWWPASPQTERISPDASSALSIRRSASWICTCRYRTGSAALSPSAIRSCRQQRCARRWSTRWRTAITQYRGRAPFHL